MKDKHWLNSQFPFPLVRTNMESIYTTPPLPESLDFKNASDETLLRHGLFLRRPRPGDHPASVAAWNTIRERGLRVITPELGPLPDSMRRVRKGPGPRTGGGGGQITVEGQGGCALLADAASGNWSSVTGALTLPYLSAPSLGSLQTGQLYYSFWVGLDGEGNIGIPGETETAASQGTLLQAIINVEFDTTTGSTVFASPTVQWWVPDPNDSSSSELLAGITVQNAPAMKSGDLVQINCGYLPAYDGTIWGSAYFLFYNDLVWEPLPQPVWRRGPPRLVQTPTFMNCFFPGPPTMIQGAGGSVEWMMENELYTTHSQSGTIMPAFSGSEDSITPVTFTYATGYSTSEAVTGDAANGVPINSTDPATSVTLAPQTVSILYTGPT